MNLQTLILTENNCYRANKKIDPAGIMIHTTGANNPNLRRYVAPDDGRLGYNPNGNHWNQPAPDGRQVCVHAFVGKLQNGDVASYKTLPWNHRGWHAGNGTFGSANDTHIGIEICEDTLRDGGYFAAVYNEAAELCAYLCELFGLDPLGDGVIIGHCEGFRRGIASNSADPEHWFPMHNRDMDMFRMEVEKIMIEKNQDLSGVSEWARDAARWVMDTGISDGKRPADAVTREEAWTMMHRMWGLIVDS